MSASTSQTFLIGPVKDALRKDVRAYAIPEDAFEVLHNAYQFRGRIIRRPGYTKLGILDGGLPVMGLRTRELFAINQQQLIAFNTTTAFTYNGTTFITLPSVMPVTWSGTNSQFFWTTNYAGAFWATNDKPGIHGFAISNINNASPAQVTTSSPNGFSSGQYVTIIAVNGYTPIDPTITPIINGQVFKITVTSPTTFTLQNLDNTPFNGTLYNAYAPGGLALNSQVSVPGQDGIRYYASVSNNANPVVSIGDSWVNYNPPIDPFTVLAGALLIFPYKGFLVFLNTWEGNTPGLAVNFQNRGRWTALGTPFYSNPVPDTPSLQTFDPKNVRSDIFGRGGFKDAATNEAIVAAGFIRDILVVYFERSTWRLRFTNNEQDPFDWERVNQDYGSQCTFSTITFDKGLQAIGNRGIVISDANDTVRFDEKIPDEILNLRASNQGFQRVYGIRTFRTRLCYWTFPSTDNPNGIFPDEVLVYNYDTKNWSFFDDTFTCFGYFYPSGLAQTWAEMTKPWGSYDITWDSSTDGQFTETVIAGNQQGYVLLLEQTNGSNDASLSITAISSGAGATVNSSNNNLPEGSWIKLTGVTGITSSDGVSLNGRNFKIANPSLDPNLFILTQFAPITAPTATGLTYSYDANFVPVIPGSLKMYIGTDLFTDDGQGIITGTNGLGIIDYNTGAISLTFAAPYSGASVNIFLSSSDPAQNIVSVDITGVYGGGGEIIRISNFDIQSKIFNFFKDNKRSRLSKIDFYTTATEVGQFTCNIFADSSDEIINTPLADNPQSNIVLTSPNPYQIGSGDEAIFRLFCDAWAQTIQLEFTLTDAQLASDAITSSIFELVAFMVSLKRGGRLP